jgi:hypothetical protein
VVVVVATVVLVAATVVLVVAVVVVATVVLVGVSVVVVGSELVVAAKAVVVPGVVGGAWAEPSPPPQAAATRAIPKTSSSPRRVPVEPVRASCRVGPAGR